jgi:hypothetical protein
LRIAQPGAALVKADEFDSLTMNFDVFFHNKLLCIQSSQRSEHVPERDAGQSLEISR